MATKVHGYVWSARNCFHPVAGNCKGRLHEVTTVTSLALQRKLPELLPAHFPVTGQRSWALLHGVFWDLHPLSLLDEIVIASAWVVAMNWAWGGRSVGSMIYDIFACEQGSVAANADKQVACVVWKRSEGVLADLLIDKRWVRDSACPSSGSLVEIFWADLKQRARCHVDTFVAGVSTCRKLGSCSYWSGRIVEGSRRLSERFS